MPIKIEKPTNPSLYSFFQGLKNVFSIRVREKSVRNCLFTLAKKYRREIGALKYQNVTISIGSLYILLVYGILRLKYKQI